MMRQYLDALEQILATGVDREGRNGWTRALFGIPMRFSMSGGFPIITTKKVKFDLIKAELLWFLSGSSNIEDLHQMGAHIWDGNAHSPYWQPKARFPGDVGRIYGVQWRSWKTADGRTIDQLAEIIERIGTNPCDRRLIVTAWNPGELNQMALPPCHLLFQFFVYEDKLSLVMYQRSCDMFLGVPFNISSYVLLLHMVAQVTGLVPWEFVHILVDAHIYHIHSNQVREQLTRSPLQLPTLRLNPEIRDIDEFTMDDIWLENYQSHSAIRAPMAV